MDLHTNHSPLKNMMDDMENMRRQLNTTIKKCNKLRKKFVKFEKTVAKTGIDILEVNEDFPRIEKRFNSITKCVRNIKKSLANKLATLNLLNECAQNTNWHISSAISKLEKEHSLTTIKLGNQLNDLLIELRVLKSDLATDKKVFHYIQDTYRIRQLRRPPIQLYPRQSHKTVPKYTFEDMLEEMVENLLMDAVLI